MRNDTLKMDVATLYRYIKFSKKRQKEEDMKTNKTIQNDKKRA